MRICKDTNSAVNTVSLYLLLSCTTPIILKIGRDKDFTCSPTNSFTPALRRIQVNETLDHSPSPPHTGAWPQGQHDAMPRIISATKKGNFHTILDELNKGVSVDVTDSEGATALYWSACRGDTMLTRYLISKGANVNHKVKWESTPLHAATDRGHTECVECLLNHHADVNIQNNNKDTPLHLAAYRGYYRVCLLLLAFNASLTLQNFKGKTPYQEAKEAGHTKIAKILAHNTKGGTFPLEKKAIDDMYRSQFSTDNGKSGYYYGECGHQFSEERQYSNQKSDGRNSEPILMAGATCSNSGYHSFPNLTMLSSFSTNSHETSPKVQKINPTITKLCYDSVHRLSSAPPHPPIDHQLLLQMKQPPPAQGQMYIHRKDRDNFTKVEDLELRLATVESLRSSLENENLHLREANLSLRERLGSYNLHYSNNLGNLQPETIALDVTMLREEINKERSLRLAAEARSRQAVKDMFTLRGRLDELLALSGPESGKSHNSDGSPSDNNLDSDVSLL